MKITAEGIALIKAFEKCKLAAYKDGKGIWTIGWGNTYYSAGDPVKQGDIITQSIADSLFERILNDFDKGVQMMLPNAGPNQHSALVIFAYNLGLRALKNSTLLKLAKVNLLDPKIYKYRVDAKGEAITESCEFLKWVSKGTVNELGLRRRRQAECDLYRS